MASFSKGCKITAVGGLAFSISHPWLLFAKLHGQRLLLIHEKNALIEKRNAALNKIPGVLGSTQPDATKHDQLLMNVYDTTTQQLCKKATGKDFPNVISNTVNSFLMGPMERGKIDAQNKRTKKIESILKESKKKLDDNLNKTNNIHNKLPRTKLFIKESTRAHLVVLIPLIAMYFGKELVNYMRSS